MMTTPFINGPTLATQFPISMIKQEQCANTSPATTEKKTGKKKAPRPINGTSHPAIRTFLYAWCGQQKLKPEYVVERVGEPPSVTFSCKLTVEGFEHKATGLATNKKECQTAAAWDFADYLVRIGKIPKADLPTKDVKAEPVAKKSPQKTVAAAPMDVVEEESPEELAKHGGWSMNNSRQRCNEFAQKLTGGPPDLKYALEDATTNRPMFVCTLALPLKTFDTVSVFHSEVITAKGRSNTKKQAAAICCLSMIRQLYASNLLEKAGEEKFKPERMHDDRNRKRKAPTPVTAANVDEESGNWTLETSKARLNQFCQINKISPTHSMTEKVENDIKSYIANMKLTITLNQEEKELTSNATGQSKKVASQMCSLDMVAQLFKLGLVEAQTEGHPMKKRMQYNNGGGMHPFQFPGMMHQIHQMPPWQAYRPYPAPVRQSPSEDVYLKQKHRTIGPTPHEMDAMRTSVYATEKAIKAIADSKAAPEVKKEAGEDVEMKAAGDAPVQQPPAGCQIQACFRVGDLAKGLVLKGELNVDLVIICTESPTMEFFKEVNSQLLSNMEQLKEDSSSKKISVMPNVTGSCIELTFVVSSKEEGVDDVTVKITVTMTSSKLRPPPATEEKPAEPVQCELNLAKCLHALAEVRRAKWFQACVGTLPYSIMIIRILRELKTRVDEWKPLQDWALQLIVEKALSTTPVPLSLAYSFKRVLECLAAGTLLPGGHGIRDPCEREDIDVTNNLTVQQREGITASAQTFVRYLTFRKMYIILGVEEFIPKPRVWGKKKQNGATTEGEKATEEGEETTKTAEEGATPQQQQPMETEL